MSSVQLAPTEAATPWSSYGAPPTTLVPSLQARLQLTSEAHEPEVTAMDHVSIGAAGGCGGGGSSGGDHTRVAGDGDDMRGDGEGEGDEGDDGDGDDPGLGEGFIAWSIRNAPCAF